MAVGSGKLALKCSATGKDTQCVSEAGYRLPVRMANVTSTLNSASIMGASSFPLGN